jgi:Cu+-exporting ATPase
MYSMGMGAAYISSVMGTFGILLSSDFMFYDTVLMLAGFLTLGRYLEARAKGRTNTAIKKLMGLRPNKAIVIRDGKELQVDIDNVLKGDIVLVKPGERIPVDGTVIEGTSFVDESMITGEPIPVRKDTDSRLIGGTINGKSLVKMEATGVGADTLLNQIIRSVKEAQGSRPEIQRVADKVVSYFIPAVLTISILAFVIWFLVFGESLLFSFTRLVSILVIACPCALGLATPTAVTVGIGRGAELGILIKNGEALQRSGSIDTVVMDKTGTITKGKPEVVEIWSDMMKEEELLRYAGSVEKGSEHPLATAVVERASEIDIPEAKDVSTIEGKGVKGVVEGKYVVIGKKELMEDIPDKLEKWIGSNEKKGRTVSLVSIEGKVVGGLAITDEPKDTSKEAVSWMKETELDVVMITGDNEVTARAIGKEVGIKDVIAGVLPGEKAERVKDLQEKGKKVAFIGDGINDAPALARADVGVAMGNGTDIAMESGDIVLVKNDLNDGMKGLLLSKKVMTRIKQNIFWAFAYNTLLIPVAAGMLHPAGVDLRPEFAGLAMAMSSVTVVSLSLLLKRYRPERRRNQDGN